jgi:hypothetical protein
MTCRVLPCKTQAMNSNMTMTMTWDAIRKTYPDEYFVIIDQIYNEATSVLLRGTVVYHGPNENAAYLFLGAMNMKGSECLWTGRCYSPVGKCR